MKIFKRFLAVAVAAAMLFSFASCKDKGEPEIESTTEATTVADTSYIREEKIRVASLGGPLGIGFAKFSTDRSYAYKTTLYSDASQIADLLKNGKTDIAVLPVNIAASVYNETDGAIKIVAVNNLGVFHILENGNKIENINDLKGKTVYSVGKGALPEYLLNSILSKNGIKGSVTVKYVEDYSEISTLMSEGKANIVMLPEPYASQVKGSVSEVRYALDLADEWEKAYGTPFTQGVVVARTEFINENPEDIEQFLMFNEISVNYIALPANSPIVPVLLSDMNYFESVDAALAAFTGCNPAFIKGENMKNAVSAVFEMLNSANPELIGGKIPDDGIYY